MDNSNLSDSARAVNPADAESDVRESLRRIAVALEALSGMVADVKPLAVPILAALATPAKPKQPRQPKLRKRDLVNDLMLAIIAENPDARGWSAERFAEACTCGVGTVKRTQCWHDLMRFREYAQRERRERYTSRSLPRSEREPLVLDDDDWSSRSS